MINGRTSKPSSLAFAQQSDKTRYYAINEK
jgi:hypothetical protein